VQRLAKEIGVNQVRLKTAQVYDYEHDPNQLIPIIDKYSRYKKDNDGKMVFKGNNQNHCWRLWHDPVITWDGTVAPCCFDKDAQHKLGSLNKQSFKELWHNKEYKEFRSKVLQSRKNIDICANCSEGVKVWG
jgi:radical SAM protein with 4Fe4S-binding SPASM domain